MSAAADMFSTYAEVMNTDFTPIAALLAVPARSRIVAALMDGAPLAAGELGALARVSRSTASEHLTALVDGGLLRVEQRGRSRLYAIAGHEVASALEHLSLICPPVESATSLRSVSRAEAMREARTCYDHLAGRLGVGLTRGFVERGWLEPDNLSVTTAGERGFASAGVDVDELRGRRRPLTRVCIDVTERVPHLGGGLGAALATLAFDREWIRRHAQRRSIAVTEAGATAFSAWQ